MLQIFVFLVFLALSLPAAARPVEIGLHVWSHHTNPDGCADQVPGLRACQNDTPGVYARAVRAGADPLVGYYKNSVGRPTWYAGAVFTPWQHDRLAFEVAVVGATGYPMAEVVPLVLPALRVELGRGWASSAGVIP